MEGSGNGMAEFSNIVTIVTADYLEHYTSLFNEGAVYNLFVFNEAPVYNHISTFVKNPGVASPI